MTKTPRQMRRTKTKDTILNAAAELILTKGFENLSLRDIARQAEYSPSGLYKYYDSKASIIKALQNKENENLIQQLNTIATDLPAKQRLVQLCMRYISFSLENPVFLILMNSIPSERTSFDQSVGETSAYKTFLDAVQEWTQSEYIQLHPHYGLEEITYALWSQIHGMATLRHFQLKNFEADFNQVNQSSIEIFLNGLSK
jgi:AcrR family transcriptional regulator